MWEWGMSALADATKVIVSEMVANAVAASRALDDGPFPVRFWLLSDRKRLLIVVWDACLLPPARLDPADDAEAGRGLMLVEAFSTQWDWYPSVWDGIEGKAVWALVSAEVDSAN
jgi:anti-sigma regulatory factor (Ser/Thr protein kinase)